MIIPRTRREFLSEVGKGMLVTSVGAGLASELGLGSAYAEEVPAALSFGDLEQLVVFMQETPVSALLAGVKAKLDAGTDLKRLTAAAVMANARSFGGEDYIGFHTMMALSPAYHMAMEMPESQRALPVMKVLYRNTSRIHDTGGRGKERLQPIPGTEPAAGVSLREAVHRQDEAQAELALAALAAESAEAAFNAVLGVVQENPEVHRVVMPYRAWDLLGIVGRDQALTMLRQSVRYCVQHEDWAIKRSEPRTLLPKLLEEHGLLAKEPGTREVDDAWIEAFVQTLFTSSPAQAAGAAAAALAEGIAPASIGDAICLTANQLVLRDRGRQPREESTGKPPGSVHGDSIGVHASDAANAWRNMARVSNSRNTFACLIMGAYQVAMDRTERGGDFANWDPLPVASHLKNAGSTDATTLLQQAEEAIQGNLQGHASAFIARYGALNHDPVAAFDLLRRYAISEDGALHAEKYYRTCSDEFASTRAAFRWRHLISLARVTASEYGRPAPGMAEARELVGA